MSAGSGSMRHPDRSGSPLWLTVSLTVAVGVALGIAGRTSAQGRLTPQVGFAAGFGIAVLAMIGLPSLSMRMVARVLLFVSAVALVRFGVLTGSLASGGQLLLAWLVAAVTVLVLADRAGTDAHAPLQTSPPSERTSRPGSTARTTGAVALVVILAAVVLAPLLLPYVGKAAEPGRGATLDPAAGGASSLRASDSLDMTSRPDLTDQVVFTVDTDRATFWRGQTFDVWDGTRWTRSDPRFTTLASFDTPRLAPDDLGARGSDLVKQRFRIEADFADVLYAVPTAVHVDTDRPVRQRADGTLLAAPLGRGATYSIISRRTVLTAERLRAVQGKIPASVAEQYAQPPVTTDRVRKIATQITAGAPTQYDKVLAIEAWMGKRVEYSLDAPLAPKGVDVVDHFLFDAEQGWCEQIASSLVVLARQNGIPARLVTGYVPGDHDAVTGVFTVRERDAHAWAEVWFPEVGWVPFDPTANVPLAGADTSKPTVAQWLGDHLVVILLGAAAIVVLVGPVRALVRRLLARRAARPHGWVAMADARLTKLGADARVERPPHQTAAAYGLVLSEHLGDDRLALVGQVIDDSQYAPSPPGAELQAEVDAILDEVAAAVRDDRVPTSA